jgi:hypothetical protein
VRARAGYQPPLNLRYDARSMIPCIIPTVLAAAGERALIHLAIPELAK